VGDVASRAVLDPAPMMLWILGTTLVAVVACVLSWGSYEPDAGVPSAAPPGEVVEHIERLALVRPDRPEN
jgi:hypothetical protein